MIRVVCPAADETNKYTGIRLCKSMAADSFLEQKYKGRSFFRIFSPVSATFRKILIDRNYNFPYHFEMELQRVGHLVCGKEANGENAINTALKESPDCILMDIRLAGKINGTEAAGKIKEKSNANIIFITGYPDEELEQQAMALDPLAILIKPLSMSKLLPLIESI